MSISIKDFLPLYPNIHDINFNEEIFNKKEFNDEKLSRVELISSEKGTLLKHQKIISRFLSGYTLYNSILLFHEMGSGKSCSAIGAIEQIQKENIGITGALILGKGDGILNNFKNELIFQCTAGQYIPDDYTSLSKKALTQRKRKQIEHFYSFNTFEKIAKELKKFQHNPEYIIKNYSNRIIVIDEVHNLRIRKEEKNSADIYFQINNMLHIVKNCKIILMSGTPMKDVPEEIASIMNLILPIENQLSVGNDFKEYLQDIDTNPEKKLELKNYFKGRVSYLIAMKSDVQKMYIGTLLGNLKHFIVKNDIMEPFQLRYYIDALRKDRSGEKNGGIYKNANQAILFVYPDGTYGDTGYTTYFTKNQTKVKLTTGGKFIGKLNSDFISNFRGQLNITDNLIKLSEYSSKYSSTINSIINESQGKSCFVYCKLVNGSGAVLFSKILEQIFGFSVANGTEKTIGKRYAIITGDNNSNTHTRNIIDRFNMTDNMNGDIIKVLIGSTVISEGFSLKNVQEIHILTPHWNYADTSQAIARGIRLGSHKDLINSNIVPIIKIYQHVSTTNDVVTMSLDLHKYEISEDKDINIKKIERLLKEAAFDCYLNYDRNIIGNNEGELGCTRINGCRDTRECDYMNCNYTCDGQLPGGQLPGGLDLSTYQLYYNNDNINIIIKKIIIIFRLNFSYNILEILDLLNNVPPHPARLSFFDIITALRKIINENIAIYNKYGYLSYLKEQNNIYFLIDSLTDTENYLNNYYCENPNMFKYNNTFLNILNYEIIDNLPITINKLFNITTYEQFLILLKNIPITVQEMIFEYSLIAISQNKIKNIISRNIIIQYFNTFKKIINNITVSTLLFKKYNILRCIQNIDTISKSGKTWKLWNNCDVNISNLYKEENVNIKSRLEENTYQLYALIEGKDFRIRDIQAEKLKQNTGKIKYTGSVCKTWKKNDLYNILVNRINAHHKYEYDINTQTGLDNCSNKIEENNITDIYTTMYTTINTESLYVTEAKKSFKNKKSTTIFNTFFNKETVDDVIRRQQYNTIKTQEYNPLLSEEENNRILRNKFIRYIYWNNKETLQMCIDLKIWFKNNNLCFDGSIINKK